MTRNLEETVISSYTQTNISLQQGSLKVPICCGRSTCSYAVRR